MSALFLDKNIGALPQKPQEPQMPPQPISADNDEMLRKISACQIMVLDISLYLDTHWNDTAMISKHNFYAQMLCELIAQYEATFKEPLTIYGMSAEDRWNWINGKWPWEKCNMTGGAC
jgi:spore coat protein JB